LSNSNSLAIFSRLLACCVLVADNKTLSKPPAGLPQTIPLKAYGLVNAAHCTVAIQVLQVEGSGCLPVECQRSSNLRYMVIRRVKAGFFVQFAIQKK
jgi:hypothetical protein